LENEFESQEDEIIFSNKWNQSQNWFTMVK
jgi:hypothetical protein